MFALVVRWLTLAMLVTGGLILNGCRGRSVHGPEAGETWAPSHENFAQYPHGREFTLVDPSGQHHFSLEARAFDSSLLEGMRVDDFEIGVLPLSEPVGQPNRSSAGGETDGQADQEVRGQPVGPGPPPLFLKLHYLDGEEPPRITFQVRRLPTQEYAAMVNAGHYGSIVLRRPRATRWSYVTFYHHHGDWNSHVLYQGWFYRCTYAYDCNPNHGVNSWRTTYGDEQYEFREDCYGRCP